MFGSVAVSRWPLCISLMVFLPYQEAGERSRGVRCVSYPLLEVYDSYTAKL